MDWSSTNTLAKIWSKELHCFSCWIPCVTIWHDVSLVRWFDNAFRNTPRMTKNLIPCMQYSHEPTINYNIPKTNQSSTKPLIHFVIYSVYNEVIPFLRWGYNGLPTQSTFPDKDSEWYSTRPDIPSRPDHVTCVRNWHPFLIFHTLVKTLGFVRVFAFSLHHWLVSTSARRTWTSHNDTGSSHWWMSMSSSSGFESISGPLGHIWVSL